jgi:TPR repeat protein
LFRKAADQNNIRGFKGLAYMYRQGEGVEEDDTKAVEWIRKGAELGDSYCSFMVYEAYAEGNGVPKDIAEAVKWLRKSAEQGAANSQGRLAGAYYQGQGVPQDYVLAYAWLNLAGAHLKHDETFEKNREMVVAKLSPAELAEAQRLSSNWQKGKAIEREKQ